jgi:BirA family biotin operon repressor/biotin-[acetyl-CoA-carboxylase] ligase
MTSHVEHDITKDKGLSGGKLILFESLPSTNTWALEHAKELQNGDVVVAHHQTAGKGRFTREWVSPPGSCLTLSIMLKPVEQLPVLPALLGPLAALAVHATLTEHSIPAMLKWPNDVLVSDNKIAGILAESDNNSLVLGIGLNVNMTSEELSQTDLRRPATSMMIETGGDFDIDSVRGELLKQLETLMGMNDPSDLLSKWEKHDYLTGREITLNTPTGIVSGAYAGPTEEWKLRIRNDIGVERLFTAGDVSIGKA